MVGGAAVNKKTAPAEAGAVLRKQKTEAILALAELEALAGTWLAGLFAFLGTGVAAEV